MSGRACEDQDQSRDGSYDILKKGRSSALHNLIGYMNNPSNHLKKYEEEVTRFLQTASEEFEQLNVKANNELEMGMKHLRKRLDESETDRNRYRNERNDLRKILHTFNKERKEKLPAEQEQLKREIEGLKETLKQKEREWTKKIKDLEESSDEIIKSQQQKIEQFQYDIKQREIKIASLEDTLERNRFGFSDRSELKKKLEDSQKQLNDTNDKLHRALAKLNQTEKELEETKTRLSKSMGDKLTDNNPNIADLSDKNRPINLAERYAELYDNQWTDAFETIEGYFHSEEDVIRALLEILKNVMDFCKDKAKRQMEDLQRNLALSDYQQEGKIIPDNIRKQLKDLRKVLSPTSKQNLYQVYVSNLQNTTDRTLRLATKIGRFVKECFEICWYMSVQDPPIVFSPLARYGDTLNTDIYKPYTSTGSRIQFVVWPALLLYENGPVLAKGVAQGIKGMRDTPKPAWVENAGISKAPLKDDRSRHIVERDAFVTNRSPSSFFQGQNHGSAFPVNKKSTRTGEDRHHRSKSEETKPKNPSAEELRLYFRYMDRRDNIGAMNALGYDVYMKCILNEHKRHLFS